MTKKRSLITRAIYAISAGRTQSTLAFLFAFTILGSVPQFCNAQQSNVQVDENGVASSTSILNSTNPNGRIGGHTYNGTLSPNTKSSRFNGGGVYGPAGNVIGVDQGVSSRFSAGRTPFVSRQNYDLVALRAQIYKEREEARAAYLKSQINLDNTPRLVTGSAPTKFPYQSFHTPRYGKTGKEMLAQTNAPSKAAPNEKQIPQESAVPSDMNPAQRIWMRGPAPAAAFGMPNTWEESAFDGMYDSYVQEYNLWNNAQANANAADVSRLGGGLNLMGPNGGALSFPPVRTEADDYRMYIEYLEAQLLRNPDVNPLSPIQIDYQNGVATVRGVVPTPSARVAAGKILLADPNIRQVNNMLTFVREDVPNLSAPAQVTPDQPTQNNTPQK